MKHHHTLAAALAAVLVPTAAAAQDPLASRDRPDLRPAQVDPQAVTPPAVAIATADTQPFILRAVTIDGSSLPAEVLQVAFEPFVGRTLDSAGLAEFQRALALAYADSDIALPLVALDLSRSADGVLAVRVTEARVAHINITGDIDGDLTLITRYAEPLVAEQPLSRRIAERYLSLMSDIPGLTVTLVPRPSATPGAVDLSLELRRREWEAVLAVDTRGSRTLGRVQLGLTVDRNGVFRLGDRTRFAVTVPTEVERFQSVSLSHRQPLGSDGAALDVGVGYLRTRPEDGLDGDAVSTSAYVSWPMIRGYRDNLVLSGGLDGVNSDNAVFGERFASERVRSVRASAAFSRIRPQSSLTASVVASQGVDGLGASATLPELTDLDFRKVGVRARVVRSFGQSWRITAAVAAQYSGDATPTSEQFTLGGAEFGRGFPTALLAGDSGWGVAGEVAWRPGFMPRRLAGSEVYVFADGGSVELNDRPGFPGVSADLASAGLGVRLAFGDRATLELEAARTLEDPRPDTEESWRGGFALTARF